MDRRCETWTAAGESLPIPLGWCLTWKLSYPWYYRFDSNGSTMTLKYYAILLKIYCLNSYKNVFQAISSDWSLWLYAGTQLPPAWTATDVLDYSLPPQQAMIVTRVRQRHFELRDGLHELFLSDQLMCTAQRWNGWARDIPTPVGRTSETTENRLKLSLRLIIVVDLRCSTNFVRVADSRAQWRGMLPCVHPTFWRWVMLTLLNIVVTIGPSQRSSEWQTLQPSALLNTHHTTDTSLSMASPNCVYDTKRASHWYNIILARMQFFLVDKTPSCCMPNAHCNVRLHVTD